MNLHDKAVEVAKKFKPYSHLVTAAVEEALVAVERDTLERAAKLCDDRSNQTFMASRYSGLRDAGAAIRAAIQDSSLAERSHQLGGGDASGGSAKAGPYTAQASKVPQETLQMRKSNDISEALKKSVAHLAFELKRDPDYRRSWSANIAMAFKDAYARESRVVNGGLVDMHTVANQAAEDFLNLLCTDSVSVPAQTAEQSGPPVTPMPQEPNAAEGFREWRKTQGLIIANEHFAERIWKAALDWREANPRPTPAADSEKYVPGLFECPKCAFVLVSNTLYMKSGTIGANNKPTECSNGCGPMWRVSWKQQAETLGKRLEASRDDALERAAKVADKNEKSAWGIAEEIRSLKTTTRPGGQDG